MAVRGLCQDGPASPVLSKSAQDHSFERFNRMGSIEMNNEWRSAINAIEGGEHVYIAGAAGTGKSELLRHFRSRTTKNYAVLAPTGVAALNVGGATIHSFFKFLPRFIDPKIIQPQRQRGNSKTRHADH